MMNGRNQSITNRSFRKRLPPLPENNLKDSRQSMYLGLHTDVPAVIYPPRQLRIQAPCWLCALAMPADELWIHLNPCPGHLVGGCWTSVGNCLALSAAKKYRHTSNTVRITALSFFSVLSYGFFSKSAKESTLRYLR